MKRLLNLSITLLIVFIASIVFTTTSFAKINANIALVPEKSTVSKNEELVINVNASNFDSGKGINVLGAVLEFDKTNFEYKSIDGKNGWGSASYNPDNGKFVIDYGGTKEKPVYGENGTMFQIVLVAKTESASNLTVNLKNIEVADGNEESKLSASNTTVQIGNGQSSPGDKEDDNNNKQPDDDGNNNGGNGNGGDNNQGGNNNQGGSGNNNGGNNNGGNGNGNDNNNGGNNNGNNNNNNNNGNNNNNNNNNNNQNGNNGNGSGSAGTNGNTNNSGNGTTGSTGGSNTSKNQTDNKATGSIPKTGVARHPVLFILSIAAVGACTCFYVKMKYAFVKPYGRPFTK